MLEEKDRFVVFHQVGYGGSACCEAMCREEELERQVQDNLLFVSSRSVSRCPVPGVLVLGTGGMTLVWLHSLRIHTLVSISVLLILRLPVFMQAVELRKVDSVRRVCLS